MVVDGSKANPNATGVVVDDAPSGEEAHELVDIDVLVEVPPHNPGSVTSPKK